MAGRKKINRLAVAIALLVLTFVTTPVSGRTFDRCSLARTLHNYGVPYDELADWVCLVEHESTFNTRAMNKVNTDGSWDWGLFQINDRYWCDPDDGRPSSNGCGLDCEVLRSDNIKPALNCARLIKSQHGFGAWVAWKQHCQGYKPSVHDCFENSGPGGLMGLSHMKY